MTKMTRMHSAPFRGIGFGGRQRNIAKAAEQLEHQLAGSGKVE